MRLLANIDVDDLERAIAFYRDGLGLTPARRLFGGNVVEMIGAPSPIEGEIRRAAWGRIGTLADPFGHGFCLIQFAGRGYGEVQSGE